jgi:hypothetical protein
MKDKKKVEVLFRLQFFTEKTDKKDIQTYLEGNILNLKVNTIETQTDKSLVKAFVVSNLIELALKSAGKGNS